MRVPIQLDLGQICIKLIAGVQMQYECRVFFLFPLFFTSCLIRAEAVGSNQKKVMIQDVDHSFGLCVDSSSLTYYFKVQPC